MPQLTATNIMGAMPQYYSTFQPQYPYYATGYPTLNGPVATNQTTTSPLATNQGWSAPFPGGQNNAANASTLRQRSSQLPQASSTPTGSSPGSREPHVTERGMASLLIVWILGVCIVALLARRLFMTS